MKKLTALILMLNCVLSLSSYNNSNAEYEPSLQNKEYEAAQMIMLDETYYYNTGKESEAYGRCGVLDGEIKSTVDSTEIPIENEQSNFGTGYGYQFGANGTIEVYIDNKWIVFEQKAEDNKN